MDGGLFKNADGKMSETPAGLKDIFQSNLSMNW